MLKNKAIDNFRQSAINFWSYILPKLEKPYSIIRWLFWKIVFYITVALVMLGIVLIIGFHYNILTFNQKLITPNAVILYRSKLPAKLTKKETKEWAEITVLEKKLNKANNEYQLLQIKKLESLPKKR
ncbi:MAG: hypothetical protein EVJ48_01235 [Candidatus Acidulodesulfobacterium acidiphilum]|uniref:Uncharacterized protein n=1 Tax=Candidatus Acidulodesulfobacterium acidiphilum TaxID=2597224 RepID=A0A520XG32_9DELT|nr:MAG: hypothetical protein EVJ48_01235 [Candidatus Acidulodesulfobacterium acidiphilum]